MPTVLKVPKDPQDVDDLIWDWSQRLRTGETVSGFTAAVSAGDVVVSASSFDATASTGTARVTGGTAGTAQSVRGRVTTSAGRQLDWTISFTVAEQ